ncbi:MAG: DUF2225 domain-containing protein [Spirochaetia bacterium]
MEKTEKAVRITYYTKDALICPVCGNKVFKEEILSGGGRLMAGKLSEELHRSYEPTKKYGEVYPLIYNIVVCNSCYFASFPAEFTPSMREENIHRIRSTTGERIEMVRPLFPGLDFGRERTMSEGVASYIFALLCYERATHSIAPTIRQGMCALRAAWLLQYLDIQHPNENYDDLALSFFRKAAFYYRKAIELDTEGVEASSRMPYLGPDTDNNYGFDGVQYLGGLLEFKYGLKNDAIKRYQGLENARRTMSRLVGMGKASKGKPSILLDNARDVYAAIKAEQKKIKDSGVQIPDFTQEEEEGDA